MSTGTGALQTTYPGQKRADKRTFNRRILLTKKDRNRPMKMTDFALVFQPIPLSFNSRKGQRTNQKYRNLVGSDQQMQWLA